MPTRNTSSDYINKKKYCSYSCINPSELIGPKGDQGPQGPTGPSGTTLSTLQYDINLDIRAIGNEFYFAGVYDQQATGESGDYSTGFAVYNNHVYLDITGGSTTGSPSVTITGTSISESTAIPVSNDTETINLGTNVIGKYQTIKKWYLVTNISFTNVTNSNYSIYRLGYIDFLNTNIKITGYRLEVLGDNNSANSDITLEIIKVANGANVDLINLENITIDGNGGSNNTGEIVDTKRSTRSYTMPSGTNLWPSGTDFVLKQTDFDTYFTSDENHILGSNNEGILLKISSTSDFDSGNAPRYASVYIYYQNL